VAPQPTQLHVVNKLFCLVELRRRVACHKTPAVAKAAAAARIAEPVAARESAGADQ
jgi:hypothetical protein